ncbi:hypothetical protein [Armatimonas sp.]|uniref:hypothetical protein n=1 Tax=Armatimonas sp. TaxID=1872638 RepID=UPI00286B69E3|nr:hypothetical protein [Armatimonas sp.]
MSLGITRAYIDWVESATDQQIDEEIARDLGVNVEELPLVPDEVMAELAERFNTEWQQCLAESDPGEVVTGAKE